MREITKEYRIRIIGSNKEHIEAQRQINEFIRGMEGHFFIDDYYVHSFVEERKGALKL